MFTPNELLFCALCLTCFVGDSRPYTAPERNTAVTQRGHGHFTDDDVKTFSESKFSEERNRLFSYSNLGGGWSDRRDTEIITYDLGATDVETKDETEIDANTTVSTNTDTTTDTTNPDTTTVPTKPDTTTVPTKPDTTTVPTKPDTTTDTTKPDTTTDTTNTDTTIVPTKPDTTTVPTKPDTTTVPTKPDTTTVPTKPDTTTVPTKPDTTTVSTTPKTSSASTIFSHIINNCLCLLTIIYSLYQTFHVWK